MYPSPLRLRRGFACGVLSAVGLLFAGTALPGCAALRRQPPEKYVGLIDLTKSGVGMPFERLTTGALDEAQLKAIAATAAQLKPRVSLPQVIPGHSGSGESVNRDLEAQRTAWAEQRKLEELLRNLLTHYNAAKKTSATNLLQSRSRVDDLLAYYIAANLYQSAQQKGDTAESARAFREMTPLEVKLNYSFGSQMAVLMSDLVEELAREVLRLNTSDTKA